MELRPFTTEAASALTPEATFGGAAHGQRHAPVVNEEADALRLSIQPWHYHAIRYLALQMEAKEVAAACDVTVQTVYALLKTPWFNELLQAAIKETKKDLISLVDANSLAAMATMVEIMNDTKVQPATRLSSAKSILEWKLGKPQQRVEITAPRVTSDDPVAEAAELERITRENNLLQA